MKVPSKPAVDIDALREAIQEEYETVACEPQKGFHFHTGRSHTQRVGYNEEWLEGVPEGSIASFAGTGNPFSLGELRPGETGRRRRMRSRHRHYGRHGKEGSDGRR